MQINGVTSEETSVIENILKSYKDKYEFFCYGSRVKGNFRPLSDLDIMIKGKEEADINDIENLKELFDNSDLPYIVNIVDFYGLTEHFYKLIKDDLVKI